jgi:hypothetical protein
MTLKMTADNTKYVIDIQSNITRKHRNDSALMTAAHILICLTRESKSIDQIASEDFDNNLELVSVWADYMIAVNWIDNNNNNSNGWTATHYGKKSVEKVLNPYLHDDM